MPDMTTSTETRLVVAMSRPGSGRVHAYSARDGYRRPCCQGLQVGATVEREDSPVTCQRCVDALDPAELAYLAAAERRYVESDRAAAAPVAEAPAGVEPLAPFTTAEIDILTAGDTDPIRPSREGNGTTYRVRVERDGVPYWVDRVEFPNGNRRYAASRFNGYVGGEGWGCAWDHLGFVDVPGPAVAAQVAQDEDVSRDRSLMVTWRHPSVRGGELNADRVALLAGVESAAVPRILALAHLPFGADQGALEVKFILDVTDPAPVLDGSADQAQEGLF